MAEASFIFNGTNEYLSRVFSTSGRSTTIFTVSLWTRATSVASDPGLFSCDAGGGSDLLYCFFDGNVNLGQLEDDLDDFIESASAGSMTNAWHHWVFRYDSTQGTADDRIRIYKDGTLLTDSGDQPSSNNAHFLFVNGASLLLGSDGFGFLPGNLAFIDMLDGVSAAPTDFAFDDGGTWTRKPYAGSYGTNGFGIDGSDGFNTTAGQSFAFTGNNMTVGDNLDSEELPPFSAPGTVEDGAALSEGEAAALGVGVGLVSVSGAGLSSGEASAQGAGAALTTISVAGLSAASANPEAVGDQIGGVISRAALAAGAAEALGVTASIHAAGALAEGAGEALGAGGSVHARDGLVDIDVTSDAASEWIAGAAGLSNAGASVTADSRSLGFVPRALSTNLQSGGAGASVPPGLLLPKKKKEPRKRKTHIIKIGHWPEEVTVEEPQSEDPLDLIQLVSQVSGDDDASDDEEALALILTLAA